MSTLPVLEAMAWGYSLAWSLSFYSQIIENYAIKSVEGLSLDFMVLNINGFLFYSLYNIYGKFIDSDLTGTVLYADLAFSLHALAATGFTALQVCYYRRSRANLSPLVLAWVVLSGLLGICGYALGQVRLFGCIKLLSTAWKYIPQLVWNYRRKSTVGWSVCNTWLDLSGGVLCVGQMLLKRILLREYLLNAVKLSLGILTICYDLGLLTQHYWLYEQKKEHSSVGMEESTSNLDQAD